MIGSDKNELRDGEKMDFIHELPFFIVHLLGLWGLWYTIIHWQILLTCVVSYYVRMFFVTGFAHRFFSHRSFRINVKNQTLLRGILFLMAFCVNLAVQKGALWWAFWHRHHHEYSDTEEDVHSCYLKGFYWSHIGWILCPVFKKADYTKIDEFYKYPELKFLETKFGYMIAPILLGTATFFFGRWTGVGGWPMLAGGFFTSTVLLWHGTFSINSLAHMFGTQRFHTGEQSRNNFWLNILTLGEGWHNNHHKGQGFTAQAITPVEFLSDITYWVLWLWEKTGMIKLNKRKVAAAA